MSEFLILCGIKFVIMLAIALGILAGVGSLIGVTSLLAKKIKNPFVLAFSLLLIDSMILSLFISFSDMMLGG